MTIAKKYRDAKNMFCKKQKKISDPYKEGHERVWGKDKRDVTIKKDIFIMNTCTRIGPGLDCCASEVCEKCDEPPERLMKEGENK